MAWFAIAALLVAIVLALGSKRDRATGPVHRAPRRRAPAPANRVFAAPKQWHPLRRTGGGDMWMLGGAAALVAERERLHHAADRLVVENPGCRSDDQHERSDDARDGIWIRDDGTWHRDTAVPDDFLAGGGSSGGGGASANWTDSSSSDASNSLGDAPDYSGD